MTGGEFVNVLQDPFCCQFADMNSTMPARNSWNVFRSAVALDIRKNGGIGAARDMGVTEKVTPSVQLRLRRTNLDEQGATVGEQHMRKSRPMWSDYDVGTIDHRYLFKRRQFLKIGHGEVAPAQFSEQFVLARVWAVLVIRTVRIAPDPQALGAVLLWQSSHPLQRVVPQMPHSSVKRRFRQKLATGPVRAKTPPRIVLRKLRKRDVDRRITGLVKVVPMVIDQTSGIILDHLVDVADAMRQARIDVADVTLNKVLEVIYPRQMYEDACLRPNASNHGKLRHRLGQKVIEVEAIPRIDDKWSVVVARVRHFHPMMRFLFALLELGIQAPLGIGIQSVQNGLPDPIPRRCAEYQFPLDGNATSSCNKIAGQHQRRKRLKHRGIGGRAPAGIYPPPHLPVYGFALSRDNLPNPCCRPLLQQLAGRTEIAQPLVCTREKEVVGREHVFQKQSLMQ